jgi:hypothetical protein
VLESQYLVGKVWGKINENKAQEKKKKRQPDTETIRNDEMMAQSVSTLHGTADLCVLLCLKTKITQINQPKHEG